jgi:hypothetical protein
MILHVQNADVLTIEGVAERAFMSVRGDRATVAAARRDMIAMPRLGQTFAAAGSRWEFTGSPSRTRDVATFTCRRVADG